MFPQPFSRLISSFQGDDVNFTLLIDFERKAIINQHLLFPNQK